MSRFSDFSRPFIQAHLAKAGLGLAFILVALLSFEAGWLKKSLSETAPVTVSFPATLPVPALPSPVAPVASAGSEAVKPASSTLTPETSKADCAFVGSKNSNKYHIPTSRCAKQIKPANLVCFASKEEAESRKYIAGCLE